MEARFGLLPGVLSTRVGYTGGAKRQPTYRSLGDHTEAVWVEFDPEKTSYEALLDAFFRMHDPLGENAARQYRAAAFFLDEGQRAAAEARKAAEEKRLGGKKVLTLVLPAGPFWPAEDYHQKFSLQGQDKIFNEIRSRFPDFTSFVDSTVAARVNGFAAGKGDRALWEQYLPELGLSPAATAWLKNRVPDLAPPGGSCPAPGGAKALSPG